MIAVLNGLRKLFPVLYASVVEMFVRRRLTYQLMVNSKMVFYMVCLLTLLFRYPACMGNGVYQLHEFADCMRKTDTETQYKVKTCFRLISYLHCTGINVMEDDR
jgi:hypothetical protein